MDKRPDLYLILRFLCVPLEEARIPHFENHWFRPETVKKMDAASLLPSTKSEKVKQMHLSMFAAILSKLRHLEPESAQ